MEPIEIASEDDLLAYLMERYKLGIYPKVHGISTLKISPDIDLLHIDEHQKIITGYEFKLLKYRRDWKRVSLEPIYKGIGQALSYFQFGVDKSILILGISKDIPKEAISIVMIKFKIL